MAEFLKPISGIGSSYGGHSGYQEEYAMPTDSKVKGIVLEKMTRAMAAIPSMGRGALLPTALAPGVVLSLLSALVQLEAPLVMKNRLPKSRIERRAEPAKYIPVGLRRCMPHGWVNAFMQLVLFLPGFAELFSFLPRSIETLREFADQYFVDQIESRCVSLASSADLVRCLMQKLSQNLFRNPIDLYAIFLGVCELVSFRYDWKMVWDVSSGLDLPQLAQKKLEEKPSELLVSIKNTQRFACCLVPRQFFTSPDWLCYDLDAFIEYRPDGQSPAGFVAYIKSEGTWYQCDDDRIIVLRSSALSAPLHRSVMLHYKRIPLVK